MQITDNIVLSNVVSISLVVSSSRLQTAGNSSVASTELQVTIRTFVYHFGKQCANNYLRIVLILKVSFSENVE